MQLLGVFALVSGVISLLVAIFDKDVAPRGLNAVFALVRIGAGLALLYCVRSGLNLIMLIFAVYLIVEGIFDIYGALKMREHRGRIFMLLNGIITIVLGLMVYAHWPSGSAWILGLFFGINLLFNGFSQLMLGSLRFDHRSVIAFDSDHESRSVRTCLRSCRESIGAPRSPSKHRYWSVLRPQTAPP